MRVLDDGGTPFDKTDDQWQTFTNADGLASNDALAIAVDASGRRWIGTQNGLSVLDDGGTLFDKSDDRWQTFTIANGLADNRVYEIAMDAAGNKWFGSGGGVSVMGDGPSVLWKGNLSINLSPAQVTTVITSPGVLSATGKLYLKATLTSPTGQTIAAQEYPFYIFPGDTVLTLNATPALARPGQAITLTGQVQNRGTAPLSNQTLTVTLDTSTIYTSTPFSLQPGEVYPFALVVAAPASLGNTVFKASAGGAQVSEVVQIVTPSVVADVQVPSVVGTNPFSLTIALTNTGRLDASIGVETATSDPQSAGCNPQSTICSQQSITLPAGQIKLLPASYQVGRNTAFTVTFTGDLSQTVIVPIVLGEAAVAAFAPQPVYAAGAIAIPYTITNTGQLPVQFTTTVTVTNLTFGIWNLEFDTYLPVDAATSGSLLFDLPAGDYTLTYITPFETDSTLFRVVPLTSAGLAAFVGPGADGIITVTADVTNTGFQS